MNPLQTHGPQVNFEYEILDKHTKQLKRKYGKPSEEVKAEVVYTFKDKSGNVLSERKFPMKSFLSNFARVLNYAYMAVANNTGATSPNLLILTTSGGAASAGTSCHTMDVTEAAITDPSQSSYGMWIGDMDDAGAFGLTAESGIGNVLDYDDYMMRRQILAASAGAAWDTDMEYRVVNVTISSNTLTISRKYQNDHATSLHYVDEIGLVGKDNSGDYFLLCRDVGSVEGMEGAYATVAASDVLQVNYNITITNASGITKNWLRQLSSDMSGGNAKEQPKDINNSAYTVDFSSARTQKILNAAANDDTHGIVVGGNVYGGSKPTISPLSTDGYALSAKLGDSDIDHGAVTAIAMTQISNYTTFGLYRDFENDRTDDKTVYIREAGLYLKETSATHYYMIARNIMTDVEPDYIAVAADEILRVKAYWKFKLDPDA